MKKYKYLTASVITSYSIHYTKLYDPYIKNELWCDLNAWVMAQWAANPAQSEEKLFNRYATEKLNLKGDDVAKFRKLCLLSAEAIVRGRNTIEGDINIWWTRDEGISYNFV